MSRKEKYNWKRTEKVIEEYSGQLLKIAYSYTGNMSDAEDIVQEVFITFACKGPKEDRVVKPWLIRVTINQSINLIQSAYRKKRVDIEEKLEDMVYGDEKIILDDELMQIPLKYRAPLYLYYYEGYSVDEIAELMKKKKSSVYTLIDRGRTKLKKIIQEGSDESKK